MKLLYMDFGSYTYFDIVAFFKRAGIDYDTASYSFADKNHDEFFTYRFERLLNDTVYDAVFSVNFFPLVATSCHRKGIKYISWSYDNPLNVINIEETLGYETNHVFLFDRIQTEGYQKKGFKNVYHMPLAVDANRLAEIKITDEDKRRYKAEVGFVGKLYDSELPYVLSLLNDYQRGYIEGAINTQGQLYGAYIIDKVLTDSFIDDVNKTLSNNKKADGLTASREAFSYLMGAETTRRERLVLLKFLANHFDVKLYSRENNTLLNKATYMGSCGYLEEMPKIFKLSDINLNINLKTSQSGIPLRVVDILGAGGFLLSSWQIEIAENFIDGEEVVLYESVEDAYEKVGYYLSHPDERIEIAKRGHEKVKELFSYEKQFGKIFKIAGLEV